MKKFLFILSLFCVLSYAYELKLNANITALKLDKQNLYIGTDKGEILQYNIKDKSLKELLSLPLECENKYKILKLYKTNASLGGGGINDLIDSSDLIIDEKVLNFFGSKECEFITCYGESMEPIIKDGSICVIERWTFYKTSFKTR